MPHLSEKFLLSRLRGRSPAAAAATDTDHPCPNCGYNLRGLVPGRACPECGQSVPRLEFSLTDDLIGTGDPDARRRWQIGLGLGAISLYVTVFARWIALIISVFITGVTSDIFHYVMAANGFLWAVAVWLMMPATIDHQWPHLKWPRLMARVTQCLWPVALGMYAYARIAPMTQAMEDRLVAQQFALRVMAGLGGILLAWILYVLADATQREKPARRMLIVVWILPFVAAAVAAFPTQLPWIALVLLVFVLFAWAWIMLLFAASLRELASHAGWSIRGMHERVDRESRITARREEFERDVAKQVRPTSPEPPGEIPLEE